MTDWYLSQKIVNVTYLEMILTCTHSKWVPRLPQQTGMKISISEIMETKLICHYKLPTWFLSTFHSSDRCVSMTSVRCLYYAVSKKLSFIKLDWLEEFLVTSKKQMIEEKQNNQKLEFLGSTKASHLKIILFMSVFYKC